MRKSILIATVAAVSFFSICESNRLFAQHPQPDSLLGASPGAFLAISVANLDTMVSWYRDCLGFSVYYSGTIPESGIRAALLQHGNALVELLQIPKAKPRTEVAPSTTDASHIHGFFKSGFVVQDIDAAYRRAQTIPNLLAYKLAKPGNGPYRTFGVRDPEGNLVQFFGR